MPTVYPMPRRAERYLEHQLILVNYRKRRQPPLRTRVACFLDSYIRVPIIMALAGVLLLLYIAFYELPAWWAQRINWRDLDRVATFACGWTLVMVTVYLIVCLIEAEQHGAFLFLNQ